MSGNLPFFRSGDELRADDLNALVQEVQALACQVSAGRGVTTRIRHSGEVRPWTMAGTVEDLGDGGIDACAGAWDNNLSACKRDDTDTLTGDAVQDLPREYLVNHGATRDVAAARGNWECTEKVTWEVAKLEDQQDVEEPEDTGSGEREGGLKEAVWREEVDDTGEQHSVAVRMFAQTPLPMWFLRWQGPLINDRQQVALWPGTPWQSVLLRGVFWWQWSRAELNYVRRAWTWTLQARMNMWGVVSFRSRCDVGDMQPGY